MRRILLLVPAVSLLIGACGDSEAARTAATVNGEVITAQDVIDELAAIDSNDEYVATIEQAQIKVRGSTEGSFDIGFVSQVLNRQIAYLLVHLEVVDRNLTVDPTCRDAALRGIWRQTGAGDEVAGQATFEKFPKPYQDRVETWNAELLALQAELGEQPCLSATAVEDYYDANPDQFEQFCAAHILVATEEEALAVLDELEDGGDFATIAGEKSIDTGSGQQGGDLGCVGRGSFVEPFEEAAFAATPGEVTEPVQSEFGFHIIRVDRFVTQPLEEVRAQIESQLTEAGNQAFQAWITEALTTATVTVDDQYGEWDPASGQITPPAVPVEGPDTSLP